MTDVNPMKLHKELLAAGLPVESVVCDGRMYFTRELNAAEVNLADALLAAHDAFDLEAARRAAYLELGIDTDALVIALWEQVIEGRPEAAAALQVLREQVKEAVK